MAGWQRKLKIKKEWRQSEDGAITPQQLAAIIADRLAALAVFGDEEIDDTRDELVDEFRSLSEDPAADSDDFDCVMVDLYDWADISLDGHWNGKKVCWVETF